MRGSWLWAIVFVSACGRVAFDERVERLDAAMTDAAADGMGALTYVFGDDVVEMQGPDVHSCGSAEASSFYNLTTGFVNWLLVWHAGSPSNDATALIVGLYDDNAGNPGSLLGGATITPGGKLADNTWYSARIPNVNVTANTLYWIATTCPVGSGTAVSVQYRYIGATGVGPCTPNASTPCTQHSGQSSLTTMPATWTPGTVFFPSVNSYYAAHD